MVDATTTAWRELMQSLFSNPAKMDCSRGARNAKVQRAHRRMEHGRDHVRDLDPSGASLRPHEQPKGQRCCCLGDLVTFLSLACCPAPPRAAQPRCMFYRPYNPAPSESVTSRAAPSRRVLSRPTSCWPAPPCPVSAPVLCQPPSRPRPPCPQVWVEVTNGYRLARPEGCSEPVYKVMRWCWHDEQSARPALAEVMSALRAIFTTVTGEKVEGEEGASDSARQYETPQRSSLGYDDADTVSSLPGYYAENEGDSAGRGNPYDVAERHNPLFVGTSAATKRPSHVVNAVYDMADDGPSSGGSSAVLYDMGSTSPGAAKETSGSAPSVGNGANANGRRQTLWATPATRSAGPSQHSPLYDMGSGEASPPGQHGPRSLPRVLNLAPDVQGGGGETDVDSVAAESVYGNEGGGMLAPATLQTAPLSANDVGCAVRVQGYGCNGVLRFFGLHNERKTPRCGVELEDPVGKNDGTVAVRFWARACLEFWGRSLELLRLRA